MRTRFLLRLLSVSFTCLTFTACDNKNFTRKPIVDFKIDIGYYSKADICGSGNLPQEIETLYKPDTSVSSGSIASFSGKIFLLSDDLMKGGITISDSNYNWMVKLQKSVFNNKNTFSNTSNNYESMISGIKTDALCTGTKDDTAVIRKNFNRLKGFYSDILYFSNKRSDTTYEGRVVYSDINALKNALNLLLTKKSGSASKILVLANPVELGIALAIPDSEKNINQNHEDKKFDVKINQGKERQKPVLKGELPPNYNEKAFKKRVFEKSGDLNKYLSILASKDRAPAEKTEAINSAVSLFVSESSSVQVSTLKDPSTTQVFPIRDYLTRMKHLKYDSISIKFSNFKYISKLHKGTDGNWWGHISFEQTFKGYIEGKVAYIDTSTKTVEIMLKLYQNNENGLHRADWDVLLSDIGVLETRS